MISNKEMETKKREINLIKKFDHQNIIKTYGTIQDE